jgi:endoglucanase
MQWRLQLNGGDYHAYVSDLITVNEEVSHITCTFTMEEASDPAPRLCVNMGMLDGCPDDMGEHSVYFDNFELYLVDDSGRVSENALDQTVDINVNQIGYLPDAEKKAVVRAEIGTDVSGSFDVVNVDTEEVVYTGELEDAKENAASGEQTAIADFSSVTEPGNYKLVTQEYGESFEFEIGDTIYDAISSSAMRMFYLQRCGEEVIDDTFGHAACHTGGAIILNDTADNLTEVSGGWHDAGDYGRYTVAGAKAAADLMLTYDTYGDVYGDDTGIPESGNGIPDILDEVKYELDFLLMMQDSETGGVYHKITCANFPESVMPEEETDQLLLSPISTTATADFAATMAMAARIFGDIDADYQKTCLEAAEKAWEYLEATPNDGSGFHNPDTISTGEYGDTEDADERYWTLAELYRATGDSAYLTQLQSISLDTIGGDLGWQNVGAYGMYAYLSCGDTSDAYYQTVKEQFDALVNEAMENVSQDAYGVALGEDDYCWGSNMGVANKGMLFLMANQLTPDEAYVTAARQQLDYLLGTNTNSYCFVTGYGTLSPENPHHRPSEAMATPMEGMLVGGPDANLEDSYAQAMLSESANAACYVDNVQSYSCNEITIYWNSPLVYLLAGTTGK